MLIFGSLFPLLRALAGGGSGVAIGRAPRESGIARIGRCVIAAPAVALLLTVAAGCTPDGSDDRAGEAPAPRTGEAASAVVGVDGALTVSTANTVLNQYAVLAADAAASANSLTVTNIADLTSGSFGPLAAGDLILVIQMQGAAIDTTDTATYGAVTNLNNAGRYEIIGVAGTNGNTINLNTSCGGLKYAYTAAGRAQVVRIPQLTTLTVDAGASVTAPAWDGTRGGVVAIHAVNTVTLNGLIDVSAKGFRGGAVENNSANPGSNIAVYRSAADTDGAEKGEGIAGFGASYANGRYGRGAPANAGGGGNSHNAGGGGGANAKANAAGVWNGQGVMNGAVVGAAAWQLDPSYNGALTTSVGGGRGGYTYAANNMNALMNGPGNALWGGDNRRQVGGLGGRPLDPDPSGRIYFGGGGGAGDGNNGGAGAGGIGGGIAIVIANSITGTSTVRANGGAGQSTSAGGNDAPGGGGGGGTVLLNAPTVTGIAIEAKGGGGGNQTIAGNESEGPGGGGGGGYVLVAPAALPATVSVAGAAGGTTNSGALTEFPANGATDGNTGLAANMPATISACIDTTAPDTTITTFEPNPTNDPTGDFTFTSNDPTATFECRIDNGAWAPCTATWSTPALADGQHTLQVRAIDQAGNADLTPAAYTWTVDTAPPDTTITTFEPNPTNDPTGDFTFASNDPTATFECSVDGAMFTPCPATFSTNALADGQHTIQVRAVDPAGNVDPTPASYTWTVGADADGDGLSDAVEAMIGTNPNDADSDDDGVPDGAEPAYNMDSDGDGIINALDPDSDNDGLFDGTELGVTMAGAGTNVGAGNFIPDADPATTTDPLNPDTDGGTVKDGVEDANHNGKVDLGERDPLNPADDIDTDGDGIGDSIELQIGTNPNDADSDDDGVIDGQEPSYNADSDGDGLINALDPDSDNDGLFDGTELGKGCGDPATNLAAHHCVADADPGTTTDPLDADTDDGTVSDGAEDANLNGKIDPGETDPTAGHGADDVGAVNMDTDGDGLTDAVEIFIGSDPNDADTDDDGLLDGQEMNPADDTDGDGLVNVLDPDSDNDGLFDGTELGKDCGNPATDAAANHCIADGDAGATKTSPLLKDTDGGGVIDGAEDLDHDGVLDPEEIDPTTGHAADDATLLDTDKDGLTDALEILIGTDPNDADSDDDGVLDGQEPNYNEDTDGDGLINALDPDSDNDGLFDGTEMGKDCGNAATDLSKMTCVADADPATITSPLLKDTDGGGVSDGNEDTNHNGKLDAGERNPTLGHGADDLTGDSDGDGLTDGTEIGLGTDPNDADSDDDGLLDGDEIDPGVDTDGDGLINALDPDSDNDGLFDGTEEGKDCSNQDTDASKNHCVADADGGLTVTSPVDADTDDGTVSDGSEDTNHNGAIDAGETNPTLGHGADDLQNTDTDGDGLSDALELTIGTDPNDADSDDDGVLDGQEPNPTDDTDEDGKINALDPDSDGDGLFDGTEMGKDCGNAATDASKGTCVADADPSTTTSPLLVDTDGGTVSDGVEDANHDGKVDQGETDPNDPADDVPVTGCTTDSDCGEANSGKVCDPATKTCVDGCHTPGNGCPSDEVCTSDTAMIGACVECLEDAQCGDAQSGQVCDKNVCVSGCHSPGNGCPSGQECSSLTVEIGTCEAPQTTTNPLDKDDVLAAGGGLFCSARPSSEDSGTRGLVFVAAIGALAAFRRRRKAS